MKKITIVFCVSLVTLFWSCNDEEILVPKGVESKYGDIPDLSIQNYKAYTNTLNYGYEPFSGYIDVYSVNGIIPNYGSSTAYLYAYLSSDVIESNNDYELRTEINYYTYEYAASLDVSYSSSTTNGNTILDDKYFKFEYASSGGINYEIPPGNYYLILKLVWNEDKNTSNNKLITPVTVY